MSGRTLSDYQAAAALAFHGVDLVYMALKLNEEAGEVAKLVAQSTYSGDRLRADRVRDELGDVLCNVAAIAAHCRIDLESIAVANIEKLRARFPQLYEPAPEGSIN